MTIELAYVILRSQMKRFYDETFSLGGPKKFSLDYLIDKFIYILKTGCQWRLLPVKNGSYKTIWSWYNKFSKKGVFEADFHNILNIYKRVDFSPEIGMHGGSLRT